MLQKSYREIKHMYGMVYNERVGTTLKLAGMFRYYGPLPETISLEKRRNNPLHMKGQTSCTLRHCRDPYKTLRDPL